jgi:hypothetical protein
MIDSNPDACSVMERRLAVIANRPEDVAALF